MLEHPDFEKTDFSYMRTGIMAGSPCPISKMQDVVNKMHMSEIVIVYGQTEASPGCTMSSTDDPLEVRVGTVGRAHAGNRMPDYRPGHRRGSCPPGEIGEFVARGYNLMKGYYKMPDATVRRHRQGRLAAHGRSGLQDRGRQFPNYRPAEGHDYPGRREHLSRRRLRNSFTPTPRSATCR